MKYIALLRGINVGGHNKIKMDELREMFSSLNYKNVKSYINSGNIIFETRKSKQENIVKNLEKAIEKTFSLQIKVVVRKSVELENLVLQNPFEDKMSGDKRLFVAFLANELSVDKQELLLTSKSEFEDFVVFENNIFCLSNKGFLDGLLGKKFIDNKLKTPATVRNWKTVNKLLEF